MATTKCLYYLPILLLCLFLTACSSPEEKKERHYLKALEYIKQEDNKAAIIELKNAIQIDGTFADARYQLGLLYLKEKNPRNAYQELIRAADLDHNNLEANMKAAELYLITRKKEESRKVVDRILEKDPHYTDALALLANLELIEGKYDEALAALQRIGDDINNSDKLLNIRGRIYAAQQNFESAEDAFKKAITIGSDNIGNYKTLLLLYQSQKEKDKAKALIEEMIHTFPDNPDSHLFMAGFHRSNGNMDLVEAELKNVVEINPKNPKYQLMLSSFYLESGEKDKAEEVLTQAREAIGENADLSAALAKLYFEQDKIDQSKVLVDETLKSKPGHGEAKLLQARFLLKDNKVREAIDMLEAITNDFPKWSEPFFFLGLARFSLGEVELAQYSVATAIELNKNESKYHALMAQLFLIESAYDDAKKQAATALMLNSKNLRAAIILSKAMIGAKDFNNAVKLLTDMNRQAPDNIEILGNLAVATLRGGDQERGEKLLEKLLELNPGNNKAVLLLAAIKYRDDLPGAEVFIKQQIAKAPDNNGLHFLLGEVLLKQKKKEEALVAFEEAIKRNPDNIRAYISAGKLLVQLDRKDEAMAKYQSMISRNPQWLQGYMSIAVLLETEGKSAEAIPYYKKALEIKPNFAPAANNLAWTIAASADGDMGEALRLAMLAKKELPDEPLIADTLGWIHYLRGSYTLAIPQFEMALDEKPEEPTITYHLALALKGNDQKDKAVEILEKLLSNDVEFDKREEAEALLAELKS